MISRRRVLAISAAAAAAPAAWAETWKGRALGADATITLYGCEAGSQDVLDYVPALLRRVEAAFSLYDTESELSRLNRLGSLVPTPMFRTLFGWADQIHQATGGLFDPSVQPLWQAGLANGDIQVAERAVGWHRVTDSNGEIRLEKGQALTFNGIAQGYATDLVTEHLESAGFGRVLVNVGEFAGIGEPWRVGIADPVHGILGYRTVNGGAIATSSPGAFPLLRSGHIFHPRGGEPVWSTVSVEATSATLADGLSTALCMVSERDVPGIRSRLSGVGRITLVDGAGDLKTL